jgi:predicted transcriptional regulator
MITEEIEEISRTRRSILEMDVAILKALKTGLRLTKLMYAININCSVIKQRLIILEKIGLIECRKVKVRHGNNLSLTPKYSKALVYFATTKGERLVTLWSEILDLHNSFLGQKETEGRK